MSEGHSSIREPTLPQHCMNTYSADPGNSLAKTPWRLRASGPNAKVVLSPCKTTSKPTLDFPANQRVGTDVLSGPFLL